MSGAPLVSVIIPNYNYSRTLGLSIRSALEQDYPHKEIIVVDDCSTDDSLATAQAIPGITVLSTPANGGSAVARNLGVEHAAGEILMFLDSDVALAQGAITEAVEQLLADPELGAVCGMYEPEPLIRDSLVEEARCLQAYYWRYDSEGSVSFLISAICATRAEVFHEIGGFNPQLRQTEEVDFGERLSQRYEIRLTNRMRGAHDDDHELSALIRKMFVRGRLRVPLYAQRRRHAEGFETMARSWAALLSLVAVLLLCAPLLLGPLGWLLPAAALTAVVLCDLGMYAFVARRKGLLFMSAFFGVMLVFNVTVATAVLFGVVHWLLSPGFRRLYEREPRADTAGPAPCVPAPRREAKDETGGMLLP
ncbi:MULTISPECIES: glycosyltransferase family A protein [unclassified Streptomyces]|uniref:glycosyltransferase n=1 Tax=unclassified Streptomyces TaxID=2593676 RepID=UPI002E0EEAA9|nr:glycosyltransferase family 2 protein [Streptomyces sp. NBC_01197]WSS52188.1 glycosyltransferase family 2 protein [Streptomyces sp. NBC_01180]